MIRHIMDCNRDVWFQVWVESGEGGSEEIREFRRYLDSGWAGADDDEMEERTLLSFRETRGGRFLKGVLNPRSDFHGIFGVPEEDCVFGNARSVESVVRALMVKDQRKKMLQGRSENSLLGQ